MTPKPSPKRVRELVREVLPDYALITRRRLERIEDIEDDADLADLDARGGVYLSQELVDRMIAGDSPLRIFRLHRGLTLDALAAKVGVTKGFLSLVENGHKGLSVDVLKKAAAALEVDLDDLV